MALLGRRLEESLENELNRVSDPQSQYIASKKVLDRFLNALPLGSTLGKAFQQIQDQIEEREHYIDQHVRNEAEYQRRAFAHSTAGLLRKRTAEIQEDIKTYLQSDIERINLAREEIPDPVVITKVVKRPGIEKIPDFVKSVAHLDHAVSTQHLETMLKRLRNESAKKEEWLRQQKKTSVPVERIEELKSGVDQLEEKLEQAQIQRRQLKVALMTKKYLETMNNPDNIVEREKAIRLFAVSVDNHELDDDLTDAAPTENPFDSAKAAGILIALEAFDEHLLKNEFQLAAQIALSYTILRSTHSLKRIIADRSVDSINASLWFCSLVFASKQPTSLQFRLTAINTAGEFNKASDYFPYWFSLGVMTPDLKMAEAVESAGQLNIATHLFIQLEMFDHVADLLVRRKQFQQLVKLFKQGRVSSQRMKNIFMEHPLGHIGKALINEAGYSLVVLAIDLATHSDTDSLQTFLRNVPNLDEEIQSDFASVAEWRAIIAVLTDIELKAKIFSSLAIVLAKYEHNLEEKAEFDFYT